MGNAIEILFKNISKFNSETKDFAISKSGDFLAYLVVCGASDSVRHDTGGILELHQSISHSQVRRGRRHRHIRTITTRRNQ